MTQYEEDGREIRGEQCGKRPIVFLIGDSIRMGYCNTTAECLKDKYDTVYPTGNCRNSQHIMTELRSWKTLCDCEQVRAVQFNCGHWDIAHWEGSDESLTSPEEYCRNLKMIIARLKTAFPNAKLIWASTTGMNPTGVVGVNPRTNPQIMEYNRAAKGIMDEENIPVNDLYAVTAKFGPEMFADYCHLTPEGFAILGKVTAQFIEKILEENP